MAPTFFSKLFGRDLSPEETLLVVDIGTLFVRAAVVVPGADTASGTAIRGLARTAQQEGAMHAGLLVDAPTVTQTARKAVAAAVEDAGVQPQQLRLGTGGGMLRGRTLEQRYRREDADTKVDERELQHMLQKMEWRAFEELRKEFARETGRRDTDIAIVSARVASVQVDGHAVDSPLGRHGQDVVMRLFYTYLPQSHQEALHAIAGMLEIEQWGIMAENDAVAQWLAAADIDNALLIDIGGVSTEISLIKERSVVGADAFTFGGQTMTYRIAKHLGVGFEEAEDVKQRYSRGSLSPNVKRRITMLTKPDLAVWIDGVRFILSSFARRFSPLPSTWLLYGNGALYPKFKAELEQQEWSDALPFTQEPTIDLFPRDLVDQIMDAPEDIAWENDDRLGDVSLLALAQAPDRAASEERRALNTNLRRILRMIQS